MLALKNVGILPLFRLDVRCRGAVDEDAFVFSVWERSLVCAHDWIGRERLCVVWKWEFEARFVVDIEKEGRRWRLFAHSGDEDKSA